MRSDAIKKGLARAPHRSLLKADGLTDEEIERPLIAVISSTNDIIPAIITWIRSLKLLKQVSAWQVVRLWRQPPSACVTALP